MRRTVEIESDSHVVLVISSLKTSDIDVTVATQAIAVVCGVECRLSVVFDKQPLAIDGCWNIVQVRCTAGSR